MFTVHRTIFGKQCMVGVHNAWIILTLGIIIHGIQQYYHRNGNEYLVNTQVFLVNTERQCILLKVRKR